MDIVEAINQRRSIRSFKPDPVPRKILQEIMELALHAPSWGNIQPWEFAIVSGQKLDEIKQAFIEKLGEPSNPDFAFPRGYPQPYDARRRAVGIELLQVMGIGREDKERRDWWRQQGLRLFGAPSAIYIYIDRSIYLQEDRLFVWPLFDCGLVAENIMLLAIKYRLGTVPQAQAIAYPDILRKILGIPDSKLMLLGISIGYPNWDDPVNQYRSEKEMLDKVAGWYGFE